MNSGMFDLTMFESKSDDDIINMNINENSEFAHKNPDTNHPSDHFETGGASGHETSIPVPGGLSETPKAKPYDAANVAIPGGDSETPKAKPYDAASVPASKSYILTSDTYNSALSKLKQSFKESVDIIEILENATIINKSVDERQEEYVENILGEQLLAAYENGPIFEAVKREDKEEVKSLVSNLRSKMPDLAKKYDAKFKPPKTFLRLLLNSSATINTSETSKYHVADKVNWWTTRFWQVLGVIYTENANIKTVIESMNEDLKDVLGEYKILYSMSLPGLYDYWNNKFGWKNRNEVFFLIVDKKLPKELKEIQNDMVDALKKSDKKEDKE